MKWSRGILVIALLMLSCGKTITHVPAEVKVYGFDFSEYSAKGFMFTPDTYDGEYESIGLIDITLFAEATKEKVSYGGKRNASGFSPATRYEWVFTKLDPDNLVKAAHLHAAKMGADAVTNVVIEGEYKATDIRLAGGDDKLKIPGLRIKGFAIKR